MSLKTMKDKILKKHIGKYLSSDPDYSSTAADSNDLHTAIMSAMEEYAEEKNKRIEELKSLCGIIYKSLCTYGTHPIIDKQFNKVMNNEG